MSQNLQNFAKFQKFQLDSLVDFEKCCQTHIYLQNFVLIQPKTSEMLPKICQKQTTTLASRKALCARRCPVTCQTCRNANGHFHHSGSVSKGRKHEATSARHCGETSSGPCSGTGSSSSSSSSSSSPAEAYVEGLGRAAAFSGRGREIRAKHSALTFRFRTDSEFESHIRI